jgi:RNA polymerase sigma-70 factor (ECF subfamily)
MFAVPFDEIGPLVERSPEATRQLASRARRRVQGENPMPDPDLGAQREAADAFFAAARGGDLDALITVLDPDVVLRADFGGGRTRVLRGATAVARGASAYSRRELHVVPAIVNGVLGAVSMLDGEPFAVGAFTVRGGKIVALDILADRERLRRVDLSALEN